MEQLDQDCPLPTLPGVFAPFPGIGDNPLVPDDFGNPGGVLLAFNVSFNFLVQILGVSGGKTLFLYNFVHLSSSTSRFRLRRAPAGGILVGCLSLPGLPEPHVGSF